MYFGVISLEKVNEFKDFVRQHPGLKDEVANGKSTWQNFYESWYLYGAEDRQWAPFKEGATSSSTVPPEPETKTEKVEAEIVTPKSDLNGTEMITQAFEYLQKVDLDKVQKTMGTFQQFIQIFNTMGGKGAGAAAATGGLLGNAVVPKNNYKGFFSQFDD